MSQAALAQVDILARVFELVTERYFAKNRSRHSVFVDVEGQYSRKIGKNERADLATVAKAARVNKAWHGPAQKHLYRSIHFHSWDQVILLSETLQFWAPRNRLLILECFFFTRPQHLSASKVVLDRIFSSLPNLRRLDIEFGTLNADSWHLPNLQYLTYSADATTRGYCRRHQSLRVGKQQLSIAEMLHRFPKLQRLQVCVLSLENREQECHFCTGGVANPSSLQATTRQDAGVSACSLSSVQFRGLSMDVQALPLLLQPIVATLRHLQLLHPELGAVPTKRKENNFWHAILRIVGDRLETLDMHIAFAMPSRTLRLLTNLKRLCIGISDDPEAETASFPGDMAAALPQSLEHFELDWDQSGGFTLSLLKNLQIPNFLPNLVRMPLLVWDLEYVPITVEVSQHRSLARITLEGRGLPASPFHEYEPSLLYRAAPKPEGYDPSAMPSEDESDVFSIEERSEHSQEGSEEEGDMEDNAGDEESGASEGESEEDQE